MNQNKTVKLNISTSNVIPHKIFPAEGLRNPIDLEDIENDDINNKGSIERNSIKQRNAKCIFDLK